MKYQKKRKGIIFTGSKGFPFGSAVIQRQIQLANSLKHAGYNVIVVNQRGAHTKEVAKREHIKVKGNYKGIQYLYSSFKTYKPSNFIIRNFFKTLGKIIEPIQITYLRLFKGYKFLFNNSIGLRELKYYSKLSNLLGMELVYDYVEMVDSLGKREVDQKDIESNFDDKFFYSVDKLLVISSFLENYLNNSKANKIPRVKIPPIIDFSLIDSIKPVKSKHQFFLYCGSIVYKDVIEFIISSYEKSKSSKNGVTLKLIINGSSDEISSLKNDIASKGLTDSVEILNSLSYEELLSNYKSALSLLIPLKNNLQDQARFPFKICEYVASKRPIITSDVPLINELFEDRNTAFIAKIDDKESFALKMDEVLSNQSLADSVGLNSYGLGKEYFNYKSYSSKLNELLEQ